MRYYYGTLKFRMFDQDIMLSVKDLGETLRLPVFGPGEVPHGFDFVNFWASISGHHDYTTSKSKASKILNPIFRYIQKALTDTMFGRGNSTSVTFQMELFFILSMVNNELLNASAFATNCLGRVVIFLFSYFCLFSCHLFCHFVYYFLLLVLFPKNHFLKFLPN